MSIRDDEERRKALEWERQAGKDAAAINRKLSGRRRPPDEYIIAKVSRDYRSGKGIGK